MGNCQKEENDDEFDGNGTGPVKQIRITNYTWVKDYQGLFDYDSKTTLKKMIRIRGDAVIIKKNSKQFQIKHQNILQLNSQELKNSLFNVISKPNHYQIHPIYIEGETCTLQKILWLVVASLPTKGHMIEQRDILKLGKQKIRIRQIIYPQGNTSTPRNQKLTKTIYEDLNYKNNYPPKSQLNLQSQEICQHSQITINQQLCRICLDPGQFDNPLITPCKCMGSVKYVHLNCLKSWLGKRLNAVKTQHCITINWLPLSCQMCKAPFRYRIYLDNKKFYTVDIPKPQKPYMIIQLMRKQTSKNGKIYHFVSFSQKKKISLGRKKDIDVKISQDMSISRVHATIQYLEQSKKFIIKDNKSKFGTLILIKKGLIAKPKNPGISVQIGAEVFSFDALRGYPTPNFQANEEEEEEYLVQDMTTEEENTEQSEEQSENQVQPMEPQIEEVPSPQLRPSNSVPVQPQPLIESEHT